MSPSFPHIDIISSEVVVEESLSNKFQSKRAIPEGVTELPLEESSIISSHAVLSPTVPQGSHFPRTSRVIGRMSSHPTLASSASKPLPQSVSLLIEKAGCFLDLSSSIL